MKSKLTRLHITEKPDDGWYLSFDKPEFQGGETIKIDKETAIEIMSIKSECVPVLDVQFGNFDFLNTNIK